MILDDDEDDELMLILLKLKNKFLLKFIKLLLFGLKLVFL